MLLILTKLGTPIGQHARNGNNVSENSKEGVENGNVDKIRQLKKNMHFFLRFWGKDMKPSEIQFPRAPWFLFLPNLKIKCTL